MWKYLEIIISKIDDTIFQDYHFSVAMKCHWQFVKKLNNTLF